MNKKQKYVTSIVGVSLIAGGLFYVANKHRHERELELNNKFLSLEKNLPAGFIQQSKFEAGFFHSDGQYKLISQEDKNEFTFNYQIEHPIWSIFTGVSQFSAVGKLNGTINKHFKNSKDYIIKGEGTIDKNNNFKFNYNVPTITLIGDTIIHESKGIVNYSDNIIHSEFNNPLITLKDNDSLSEIKNIKILYNFDIDNYFLGIFSLNVGEIKNNLFKVNNINLSSEMSLQDNKYSVNMTNSVDNVDFLNEKNIKAKFVYSINNLDVKIMKNLQKAYQTYKSNKIIEAHKEKELFNQMYQLLKAGVNFKINEFTFKNPSGNIDFSSEFDLKPSATKVSLYENGSFKAKLNINGQLSAMANMYLKPYVGETANPEKIDMEINFDKNQLLVNKKALSNDESEGLKAIFLNIDKNLDNLINNMN